MAVHSSFLGFDITAIHQTGSILFGHSERNDADSDLDQMRQSRGLMGAACHGNQYQAEPFLAFQYALFHVNDVLGKVLCQRDAVVSTSCLELKKSTSDQVLFWSNSYFKKEYGRNSSSLTFCSTRPCNIELSPTV